MKATATPAVSKDDIEADKSGKFIDVPTSDFDENSHKIKSMIDKHSEAKIEGLTKNEMEDKES